MAVKKGKRRFSNSHGHFDNWVWLVLGEFKVVHGELVDRGDFALDLHFGPRARLAGKLLANLLDVVRVDVGIAQSVNELARLQIGNMRHHYSQKCIRGFL